MKLAGSMYEDHWEEVKALREENARLREKTNEIADRLGAELREVRRLEGLIVRYGGSDIQAELRAVTGVE